MAEVRKSPMGKSGSRAVKGPNPQVNWRVEEDLKTAIEDEARRRGVSAGEVIRELWQGSQTEMMALLRETLAAVRSLKEDLTVLPTATPEPTSLNPFAYREPQASPSSQDPVIVPPTPGRLRWLRRR
jgi:hypothetical protein